MHILKENIRWVIVGSFLNGFRNFANSIGVTQVSLAF